MIRIIKWLLGIETKARYKHKTFCSSCGEWKLCRFERADWLHYHRYECEKCDKARWVLRRIEQEKERKIDDGIKKKWKTERDKILSWEKK